jgi:S1-C subfamily serine protease
VAVVDVLQDSAASQVGLEKGDLIVRYGDERIFSVDELRRETLAGNRGETTPVDLLRSGAAIRRNVPRGPLGIRMRPASVRPPPPR